eukprot:1991859-Amphidinium_carterae.1
MSGGGNSEAGSWGTLRASPKVLSENHRRCTKKASRNDFVLRNGSLTKGRTHAEFFTPKES